MPWPPWAPPRTSKSAATAGTAAAAAPPAAAPPGVRSSRRRSGSFAEESPSVSYDALGTARLLRTESLTAICLLIIATCALCFLLYFLRAILIPFAIAVFLMYLLQPMVNYMCKPPRRWCDKCSKKRGEICCEGMFRVTKSRTYSSVSQEGSFIQPERHEKVPKHWTCWGCLNLPLVPRWVAVLLAIGIMLSALVTLGVIVYGSVLTLQEDVDKYEAGAREVAAVIDGWMKKYNYSLGDDLLPFVIRQLRAQVPRMLKMALSSLEYFFLVTIFLIYLLISPVKPIKSSVWGIIDLHIRRYIRLKTIVGMLSGSVVTLVMWMLGVHMAHVFGLVTFALNFVPNLGSVVATFLPMPLVIFDPDLPTLYQVLAFVLPTLTHLVIGNFVEPWLFGESFELSPVVVLMSLAFWGSLWGIPGMILAVPLIVITRIVCDHLEHPYSKTLMRLLAGNVFEARDDQILSGWDSTGTVGDIHGMADASWRSGDRSDEALVATEFRDGRRSRSRSRVEASSSSSSSVKGEDVRRSYGSTVV